VQSNIDNNYNSSGQPYNKGEWSADEDTRLIDAMKRVLNTDDLTQHIFTKNIQYKEVKIVTN